MRASLVFPVLALGCGGVPPAPAEPVNANPAGICTVKVGWTQAQVADTLGWPCWETLQHTPPAPPSTAGIAGWAYGAPSCAQPFDVWWVGFDASGAVAVVLHQDGAAPGCAN